MLRLDDPIEFVEFLQREIANSDNTEFSIAFEKIQVEVIPFTQSKLIHNHQIGRKRLFKNLAAAFFGGLGFHTPAHDGFAVESAWRAASILFPTPLMLDLFMESHEPSLGKEMPNGRLEDWYSWSATVPELGAEVLKDDLRRRLCELAGQALVCMTDESLDFGPLPPDPKEAAKIVSEAVWLIPELLETLKIEPPETWE